MRSRAQQLGGAFAAAACAWAHGQVAEPVPASAEPSSASTDARTPANDISGLLDRLDALERRNAQLEQQVSDLQSESGQRWLTEERASQIRGIVADVVADADSRASLQGDQMTAGWNDGFFLSSPDGRFALKVGGMLQTRFIWSSIPNNGRPGVGSLDNQQNRAGFDLGQTELWMYGHAFSPDITFGLRMQVANENSVYLLDQNSNVVGGSSGGSLQVLDAWVKFAMDDAWSVRAGQFRLPYSRETLVQQQNYLAVDRSVIDYHLGLGYSQGLELEYVDPEWRMRFSVNDGAQDYLASNLIGVAGGLDPLGKPWFYSGQPAFVGRFEWKPYGSWKQFESFTSPIGDERGLLFGLGWHWQNEKPYLYPNPDPDVDGVSYDEWFSVTADMTYMLGGASLFLSGYWNTINSNMAVANNSVGISSDPTADLGSCSFYGFVAQGAYYFETDVEGYARFEWGNYSIGDIPSVPDVWENYLGDSQALSILTIGANWYIDGEDVKLTTDLGYAFNEVVPVWNTSPAGWRASGRNEIVFRTKFQLVF